MNVYTRGLPASSCDAQLFDAFLMKSAFRADVRSFIATQSHSISDGPPRSMGSNAADDSWTETINAVSSTLEENMRTAVNYAR